MFSDTTSSPWRCPRCRGPLVTDNRSLRCEGCWAAYPVVAGIPDLRVPMPAWVDFDRDAFDARRLAGADPAEPLDALVRRVFASRPGWTDARIAWRTRQVIEGPQRARRDVARLLARLSAPDGPVLEIGCGPGGFLAALPASVRAVGTDVSLVWLVVAQRLVAHHGRAPALAAAVAEALPLADATIAATVAFDVIEHVGDLGAVVREIDRVSRPGAAVACTTPNRFSLAAEPHVGVWGVGWLPRRYQRAFVEWRTGEPYQFVRLLSAREVKRMFAAHTAFDVGAGVLPVPGEEISGFPALRAAAARMYNRLSANRAVAPLLVSIGPFFEVSGTKKN